MRHRRLQRIKTIVLRQQRVPPERDDDGFFIDRQNGGFSVLRPGWKIGNRGPLAPFGHGLLVRQENDSLDRFPICLTPVTRRQRPQAFFTSLYCPPLGDCCAITCRPTDGFRIADNKLTELGGWDDALLLQELQARLADDFDLGLVGITEDELDALLADADDRRAISDDAADGIPEPPAEPITRPGDLWAMGKHRLCCGDATDAASVARLMQGEQATLMFTSPPYAQLRDYGAAKEKVHDWDALMQGVFAEAPVTPDAQVLVNLGLVHRDSEWQPYWEGWVEWMRASGWRRFGWYVWDQGPGLPGDWNGRLAPSHEFIFHFNRAPRKPHKTVPSKHAGETLGGGGLRGGRRHRRRQDRHR